MEIKFSPELLSILRYAREEAMRTGNYGIGADHILLGLLRHCDNNAFRALALCGVDPDGLKTEIEGRVFAEQAVPWHDQVRVRPTRNATALLSAAAYEALKHNQHDILSSHFLLALIRSDCGAAELLRGKGLAYEGLYELMRQHRFVLPRTTTQVPLPRVEELLGPLGEQLTRLYAESASPAGFSS